jgi:hypothetical protein
MRARGFSSKDELGTPTIFMAGGLAGCLGWSVIMPFDVAKTRLQSGAARGPLLQLMSRIIQEEGVRALFTGWSAAVWIDRSNQTIDAHVMTRVPLALWPTTRPPQRAHRLSPPSPPRPPNHPPSPPIIPHHPPSPPIKPNSAATLTLGNTPPASRAQVVRAFPANAGLFLGVEVTSRLLRDRPGSTPGSTGRL